MFKRILLPTDGSQTSRHAAFTAAEFLKAGQGVEVTIVLAVSLLVAEESDFDGEYVTRHNNTMVMRAEAVLQKAAAIFAEKGIAHNTKIIHGDPVSLAIDKEATSGGYDIIIMGSHGLGMEKTDTHYLGSVTERVIRRSEIPVMVIPVHHIGKGRGDE